MAKSARAPWNRRNPRKRAGKASTHLTPAQKSAAKRNAKRAGRHYPNLVDNMRAAAKVKKAGTKSAKKTSKKRVGLKRVAHKAPAKT